MLRLIFLSALALLLCQCKSTSQSAESISVQTPAPVKQAQIDFDDIKVVGQLLNEDGKDYLLVEKILLRGRTAPVIAEGEKLLISKINADSKSYKQPTEGMLTCKNQQLGNGCEWHFKPNHK